MLRLTLQADDSYILRPAHVVVKDASALRIRLEDYDIRSAFSGGTVPSALRLIPGRLPLRRLEVVANNALQYALLGRDVRGWDVCGGVLRARRRPLWLESAVTTRAVRGRWGAPVAKRAAVSTLRSLSVTYPLRLVVRLCTDEREAVRFWNGVDEEAELPLDVIDDFEGEAREVHSKRNGWLCYSPALHTLRESGTLIGLLDLLDERQLSAGESATLASLLLDGGAAPLPDWKHEPEAFASAVTSRAQRAGHDFDGYQQCMAPRVDAPELLASMGSGRRPGRAQDGYYFTSFGWTAALCATCLAVLYANPPFLVVMLAAVFMSCPAASCFLLQSLIGFWV